MTGRPTLDPDTRLVRRMPCGALLAALALMTVACGRAKTDADAGSSGDTAAAAAQDSGPGAAGSQAAESNASDTVVITAADIDAYQRGREAELAEIRRAGDRIRAAKTANDTLNAMGGLMEQQTTPAAARAAGMPENRWKEVAGRIDAVLSTNMGVTLASSGMKDSAQIPAAMRAQMREMAKQAETQRDQAYARLSPPVAKALRARSAHLDSLRLTVAGMRVKMAQ